LGGRCSRFRRKRCADDGGHSSVADSRHLRDALGKLWLDHAVFRQGLEGSAVGVREPPALVGGDVVSDVDRLLRSDQQRERERIAAVEIRLELLRCRWPAGPRQRCVLPHALELDQYELEVGHSDPASARRAKARR
jgi:hypothetical protein